MGGGYLKWDRNLPFLLCNSFVLFYLMHVLYIFQHVLLVALKECKLWGSGKRIKDATPAQVSFTSQI